MDSDTILKSIEIVTAKWTKQREQEKRNARAAANRRVALTAHRGPSIKDAAWDAMAEAYMKASSNNTLPASARQIYYQARPAILEITGRTSLDSQYFTQALLPEFIASHSDETANWDVTYDARGHFTEPHTMLITPLGTLDVRHYLAAIAGHCVGPLEIAHFIPDTLKRFPTCGPANRFSAILFIEKEGFMPVFAKAKLAERYDIAIMSTKGMPVVACRHLADELCGQHGIPLPVLHDFDKAGFSIFGTLDGRTADLEETARYEYRHDFEVIDLGLHLADVREYQLDAEVVSYPSDPSSNLRNNGANDEEIEFLCGGDWKCTKGQRVELNAFTSGDFIKWIEAKLKANGIGKVIPHAETLEVAYRRALQIELVQRKLVAVVDQAGDHAEQIKPPADLGRLVRRAFKADATQSWDAVIAAVAAKAVKS